MKIILVRHGQVYNPDNVLYGKIEGYGLSQTGVEQVLQTAEELKHVVDKPIIVCSPLQRTRETAAIIAEAFNTEYVTDARLIESESYLEGFKVAGGKNILKNPQVWKYLYNPFKPSWGEPYKNVLKRMANIVEEYKHQSRDVIFVTHELPMFILKRKSSKKPLPHNPRQRKTPTGSWFQLI